MATIDRIKSVVQDYFETQPVKKAWVFGSYARGEETPESDIDILVDYGEGRKPSLFTIAGIKSELEERFKTKVDLVPEDCLYDYIRPYVDRDKILIYERS
ncbi:MAG: nucleotidyltransferase family protein [Muribaculaceae bacterium]|nr:nucleotidyltransferase family protein [Muribaculaceae bacterium]